MKKYGFAVIHTLIVLMVVLSFYAISWFGESYRFRAEPFDPFDPIYGEYVMLQYPDLKPDASIKQGLVYVTFATGKDGYARIDQISNKRFFGSVAGEYYDEYVTISQLTQYYVEQGTGKGYEDAEKLEVKADVSPWGTVRATDLLLRNE
ncbi:GDYXXLXY domain-containing protein [Exiguobacterium oxidotolerans]|uniref:GDYXXLXY domain-containing protein n=1 Tax=Exiguobacterium oxidotolerans TaxID=223958 RepID=A0A653IHE6_9BACL|nr:GDYXXLXY domain-containing protein [Exiguobacterium oxidotolerans]VWX38319.1 conserved hypothetical protein [Exiguobacterium oxidotolerans]